MGASFVPIAYGIDDLTLGFDMEGSGSIQRLNELPGSPRRREARKLGYSPCDHGVTSLTVELAELLRPYLTVVDAGRGSGPRP
jgi:hypothetical protein